MVAIVRSLDARLLREREEERQAEIARRQAAAFRSWMDLGDRPLQAFLALAPQVPTPGQLNPVGRLYERERAADPSLRPTDVQQLIARQPLPPPRARPQPLPLPPPQPAFGLRPPTTVRPIGPGPDVPLSPEDLSAMQAATQARRQPVGIGENLGGLLRELEAEVELFRPLTAPVGAALGRGAAEAVLPGVPPPLRALGVPDFPGRQRAVGAAETAGRVGVPEVAVPSSLAPFPVVDEALRLGARALPRIARTLTGRAGREVAEEVAPVVAREAAPPARAAPFEQVLYRAEPTGGATAPQRVGRFWSNDPRTVPEGVPRGGEGFATGQQRVRLAAPKHVEGNQPDLLKELAANGDQEAARVLREFRTSRDMLGRWKVADDFLARRMPEQGFDGIVYDVGAGHIEVHDLRGIAPVEAAPPARAAGEAAEEVAAPSSVDKLTELVKSAKPVLRETTELRRRELGRRAEQVRRGLAGTGTGEEAQARTFGALKGELPTASFEPPVQSMAPDEVDSLRVMVRDHFNVRPQRSLSAAPTFVALDKVLGGNLPNASELKLLEEVFGEGLARSLRGPTSLPRKAFDEAAGALSLWRTFITGGEQSVAFRQAAIPGLNPLNLPTTTRAIKRSLQAGFSDDAAVRIADELAARPEWTRLEAAAERSGRQLFTKFRGIADPLAREEGFTNLERTMIGRLARRTPLLGQYLRFSERNAVTLLNSFRLDLGAKYLKVLDNLSPTGLATASQEEEAARLAAVFTGRGKVPANEVGQIATRALFSAQLQASRIETPFLLLSKSPAVRKLVAQELAGFMTFGLTLLSAAKLSGAADVELDPRSTDFGKIRIGPTRIDVWGGFQPYVRLVSQLATGKRKTSLGELQDIGLLETAQNFITNKTAPAVNLAIDIRRGETAIGEPLEASPEGIRRELQNRVTPLITQDVVDAMKEHDSFMASAITPLVWFGIGAQSYTTPSVRTAQTIGEDLLSGKLPDAETYDDPPLKIGDLTPRDRDAFLALHPDIEQGLEERTEEVVGGLSQREEAATFGALAGQAGDAVKEGLDTLTTDVQGGRFGDASEFDVRRTIWDQATDLFAERRGAIKNAEAVFAEQVERRGEREPSGDIQRTLNRFFEFTDQHGDLATEEEWTARDVAFEREFSEAEQRDIETQLGVGDHRIETERQRLSAMLDPYYAIPAEPARRREAYRRTHPTEDAALWALGRVATVMTPAARSRAQGFWQTLFQGPVSVPFRRGQGGAGGGRLPPPVGGGGSTLPPPIGGR